MVKLEVKKDRIEIQKIIKNCMPLMKINPMMMQECEDAILVYLIEKDSYKILEKNND